MKQYPTIPVEVRHGEHCYVFDKIDGSNVRAEWSRKRGFYKFGSRKQLISHKAESDQQERLGEAIDLMREQEDTIARVLAKQRVDRAVCFFEFWGDNSFAGLHEDEPHHVTLIDVSVFKRGILDPRDFLKWFQDVVHTPPLLLRGSFNREIEEQVRSGELPGMDFEGVVAKAPRPKKWDTVPMFKVKNRVWIEAVKARYGSDAEVLL